MRNNAIAYCRIGLTCLAATTGASAQEQPLSVIDWLKTNPDQPAMTSAMVPKRFEPSVTPNALAPEVVVRPLEDQPLRIIGLVPSAVTGLPQGLWSGSTAEALVAQIETLPEFRLPAAQALLYTLLLTETTGPGTDSADEDLLTLARADALIRFGATDPAMALLEQADVTRDVAHFAAYMNLAMLTGQEDTACAILSTKQHLAPSMGHRIFCTARQGDWPTAALLFDTSQTLGTLPDRETAVLERFLHPEAFEDVPPLPRPDEMTPLLFRLYEAIGEPQTTRQLPRAYAVADLRDLAGWKTQLEAAERLAVTGAIPANRLLGLYSARDPAASGGIWDRVSAIQRFETALRTRSTDAIAKSLPVAWDAVQSVGLEIIFAELFAAAIHRYELEGDAGRIAQAIALLSPDYQRSARDPRTPPLLAAIARGDIDGVRADNPREAAILAAFDDANARRDLTEMARNNRMGEAILRALVLLDDGAAGDPVALTQALATLRVFGLEDTVRRAALQVLLLERYS
jgi:hypothetical protein